MYFKTINFEQVFYGGSKSSTTQEKLLKAWNEEGFSFRGKREWKY